MGHIQNHTKMTGTLKVSNIVASAVNIGFFWSHALCNEAHHSRHVCVALWSYVW